MSAYVVASIDVKDGVDYARYAERVPATLEPYGGMILVRGGNIQLLEGHARSRIVVLHFASSEQAKRWYFSEEYTKARVLRQEMATSDVFIVEGV